MIPLLREQVYPQKAHLFNEWRNAPPFRAFRAMSGLPALHGTRPDNMPGREPYLHADPARAAAWKEQLCYALLQPRRAASASSGLGGRRTTTIAGGPPASPRSLPWRRCRAWRLFRYRKDRRRRRPDSISAPRRW